MTFSAVRFGDGVVGRMMIVIVVVGWEAEFDIVERALSRFLPVKLWLPQFSETAVAAPSGRADEVPAE